MSKQAITNENILFEHVVNSSINEWKKLYEKLEIRRFKRPTFYDENKVNALLAYIQALEVSFPGIEKTLEFKTMKKALKKGINTHSMLIDMKVIDFFQNTHELLNFYENNCNKELIKDFDFSFELANNKNI